MKKVEKAVQCFNDGFSCSQAVFSAYSNELGLEEKSALKIGGAFGAGMGYQGEACGAVTGALMLIGLKYGKWDIHDNAAKEQTYALVQAFIKKFKSKHGTIRCRELLKYDIGTEEGLRKAREEQLFTTCCAQYVKDAAEIVEKII